MNDDFLHRVRKEPRPEFLRSLKERLDRIDGRAPKPIARSRSMRTLFAGVLIGASALALASLALEMDFAGVRGMLNGVLPFGDRQSEAARGNGENQSDGSNELVPAGRAARGLRTPWTIASRPGQDDQAAPARRSHKAAGSGDASPGGVESESVASAPASYVVGGSTSLKSPRTVLKIIATAEIASEIRNFAERSMHNLGPFGPLKSPEVSVADDAEAFAAFCKGSGVDDPDIIAVARRITPAEAQACVQAKTGPAVEIPIGYQAVVILRNKASGTLNLTSRELFLALVDRVPDPSSAPLLQANVYAAWNQINPALGYDFIHVIGPPLSSVGGRGLKSIIMKAGCRKFPWLAGQEQSDPMAFDRMCTAVRTHYYEEAGYEPTRTLNIPVIARLTGNPAAIGVVGYLTYELLTKTDPGTQVETIGGVVQGGAIDGIEPSRESIAAGTYPGSRTLYLYVNRAHTRPPRDLQPIRDQVEYFVRTFAFPEAMSNDPSLVPMPWEVAQAVRTQALAKLSNTN
jgi:phosphate transport system substrate-binding protein